MLSQFLHWWFSELAALFGSGVGSRNRDTGDYLRLSLLNGQVLVGRQRGGRIQPLAELSLDDSGRMAGLPAAVASLDPARTRCRVVLPADKVLTREIDLPLVAEENLREVLGYEMDRQTPFRASEVYYDYRILMRDPAAQKLRVCLKVARRSVVDNLIAHLGHWDLQPVHSLAVDALESDFELDFEPGVFKQHSATGFNLMLAGIVLVLAIVAVALPLREQQQMLGQLATRFDQARLAAAQAVKVRDLLDDRLEASAILDTAKQRLPTMVEILEELSRSLPDDTYLFRLEVRDEDLSVQGSSKSASALIGILEQSPYLSKARFASPVTREGTGGRERFHISARLLPRKEPAVTVKIKGARRS